MTFDDYIEEEKIIRLLARLRVRVVKKRHADELYWRLGKGIIDPAQKYDGNEDEDTSVSACLPSRKHWGRLPRKMRKHLQQDDMLERGIIWAVYHQRNSEKGLSGTQWGRNLLSLLTEVKCRSEQVSFELQKPKLITIPKSPTENRCLSKYEKLSDRILLIQVMKYVRDQIDDQFSSSSYAFRKSGSVNHVTAIRKLREYRLRYPNQPLYVAECDVMSFFDTINHEVVLAAYDTINQHLKEPLDNRARAFIEAYLKSYSSFKNVKESFSEEERGKISFFNSPELRSELKAFYGAEDLCTLPLGLPQGGALSPILINLVMDCVDRAVLDEAPTDIFYARYCDDMVIVHPDKSVCSAALERYCAKMKALYLPVHKVYKRIPYGKAFYGKGESVCLAKKPMGKIKKIKSKGPYAWESTQKNKNAASPWVSFLGQQIRFDGDVRIRQESLDKQRTKLRKEYSKFIKSCGNQGCRLRHPNNQQAAYWLFQQRLIALGVGYVPNALRGSAKDLCWLSAFPGITACTWTKRQMRWLDRERDAVLCKVRHNLLIDQSDDEFKFFPKFAGKPFSYLAYLERLERPTFHCQGFSQEKLLGNKVSYDEW